MPPSDIFVRTKSCVSHYWMECLEGLAETGTTGMETLEGAAWSALPSWSSEGWGAPATASGPTAGEGPEALPGLDELETRIMPGRAPDRHRQDR